MTEKTMHAMYIEEFGGPEQLVLKELPMPVVGESDVLVRVRALGINRAETYMRRGVWGDGVRVSGIECVGEVEQDATGTLPPGSTVAAIMGGMGRTRNGSYAQYVAVPATNVFPLKTDLGWTDLAAIPESYATAWSCLFSNLTLKPGHTVLIRGATSALGQAAVNIASQHGANVLGATRSEDKAHLLKSIGVSEVVIEVQELSRSVRERYPEGIDGVLDLLGNSTFQDSLRMVRKGGAVCIAGFLGGAEPVPFDALTSLVPGVNLNFFASFMLGTANYPLSDIPMQKIVDNVSQGAYKAKPARVFRFAEIPDAHRLMESNQANGKIVVVMD